MENFISTLVFILPGFLMYFWIQSFGINPVIKHNPGEMGAISALLWFPVSILTVLIYNLVGMVYRTPIILTLYDVKTNAGNIEFLAWFAVISIPVSFSLSYIYVRWLYPLQRKVVNSTRKSIGIASFSEMPAVWDEFFLKVNETKNEGALPVKMFKIDKPENTLLGVVKNASRPFETERALILERSEELLESDLTYQYEVIRSYVDIKNGMVVQELDLQKPTKQIEEFNST
ncbi:hypothetical protein ABNB59_16055 [Paenibacillus larvae]|uniref:Uncharacterized protein n=2 Tax=Paenibacillus larvae TaxID=1464 RepID=A0A6C0QN58_9BACL|nr:hypothetical protein [Paenibacillus larvae]AQR79078.1 hypothetical protein BXP28_19445 [Paenibacillus larvae subsp. larvae]AVF23814.1 hypothetical protein ERICI_04085 [Paenibacillus larvae subsp. larvae]ETK29518.1 hypothetical protein ERIC1_1c30750 [Paenibacillus larvae subsp. larvae DSM 25719]MCY7475776.1 hypothetical protein [Paenibacillus larvae]MCY7488719.1 hypothetical protein [Paenibacillus larvae]